MTSAGAVVLVIVRETCNVQLPVSVTALGRNVNSEYTGSR